MDASSQMARNMQTGVTGSSSLPTHRGPHEDTDGRDCAPGCGSGRRSDGSIQVQIENEIAREQVIAGLTDQYTQQAPVRKLSRYEMPTDAELELEDTRILHQLKKKRYFLYLLEKVARQSALCSTVCV